MLGSEKRWLLFHGESTLNVQHGYNLLFCGSLGSRQASVVMKHGLSVFRYKLLLLCGVGVTSLLLAAHIIFALCVVFLQSDVSMATCTNMMPCFVN